MTGGACGACGGLGRFPVTGPVALESSRADDSGRSDAGVRMWPEAIRLSGGAWCSLAAREISLRVFWVIGQRGRVGFFETKALEWEVRIETEI